MDLLPFFDSSLMPFELGSVLRTPRYAWKNWGVSWENEDDMLRLLAASERAYENEWTCTDSSRYQDIATAAERAGLEDANTLLNAAVARVTARLVTRSFRFVDIGAGTGATAKRVLLELPHAYLSNTTVTLVDPASQILRKAKEVLKEEFGATHGVSVNAAHGNAIDLLQLLPTGSQHLAIGVASLHHQADILPSFRAVRSALGPDGWFVIGDWHHSMWEHPGRVFEFFNSLSWPDRKAGLEHFIRAYPSASCSRVETSSEDTVANSQICDFWRFRQNSSIPLLEGHRPVGRYVEALQESGFEIVPPSEIGLEKNPWPLIDNSNLLCVTVARRTS